MSGSDFCIAIIEWIIFILLNPALTALLCYVALPIMFYTRNYGSGWSASRKGIALFCVAIIGFFIGFVIMWVACIVSFFYTIYWIIVYDFKAARTRSQGSCRWMPNPVADFLGTKLL